MALGISLAVPLASRPLASRHDGDIGISALGAAGRHPVSCAIGQPASVVLASRRGGIGSAVPLASRHSGGHLGVGSGGAASSQRCHWPADTIVVLASRRWASGQSCHLPAGMTFVSASRRWDRRGGIRSAVQCCLCLPDRSSSRSPSSPHSCRLLCGITKASTTLSGGLRVTIPPLLTTESSTSSGGIVLELAHRSSEKITQAQTCLEGATASQLVSFEKPAPDSTCGCRQAGCAGAIFSEERRASSRTQPPREVDIDVPHTKLQ